MSIEIRTLADNYDEWDGVTLSGVTPVLAHLLRGGDRVDYNTAPLPQRVFNESSKNLVGHPRGLQFAAYPSPPKGRLDHILTQRQHAKLRRESKRDGGLPCAGETTHDNQTLHARQSGSIVVRLVQVCR